MTLVLEGRGHMQKKVKGNVVVFGLSLNWPVKFGMLQICSLCPWNGSFIRVFFFKLQVLCLSLEGEKTPEIVGLSTSVSFYVRSFCTGRYEVKGLFRWIQGPSMYWNGQMKQFADFASFISLTLSPSFFFFWISSAARLFAISSCSVVIAWQVA